MSELNEFALKVASLLDTIADAPPETSSVPGAPFHLTLLEMGKIAKLKHASMKKRALDPLTLGALGLGGLGGLGMLGRKAMPAIEKYFAGQAAQRAQQAGKAGLEQAVTHFGPRGAAEKALAGMAVSNADEFGKMVGKLPGVMTEGQHLKELKALQDQFAEQSRNRLMMGGLGLGGLYAGHQMGKPDAPQQSNLPQIIRYG